MKQKPTQKQMVLNHLKMFGSLDAFTAFYEYGIFTSLHARITELRQEGHKILTDYVHGKSKITGRGWSVAKYIYKPER